MSDSGNGDGEPPRRRLRRLEPRGDGFASQFVGVYGLLAGMLALFACLIGMLCLWLLFVELATQR